jgi:effector-binding domain-containing protein
MTISVVQLQRLPSVHLAAIRRVVASSDLSRVVPELCGLAFNAVRAQQLQPGRNVACYWNNEIRLEAGVELEEPFEAKDGLVRSATPAGLTAFTTHFGPYGQLGEAHDAIIAWCNEHKRRLAGPRWEVYGHWQPEWNDHPERIRTDVFYHIVSTEVFPRPTPP